MSTALKKNLRLFGLCYLAWTLFGLFFFTEDLTRKVFSGDPTPWWNYLVSWFTGMTILAVLTPGVLWLFRRFPFERRKWPSRAALHLAFSIGFAFFQLAVEGFILSHLGVFHAYMQTATAAFFFLLVIGFHQTVFTYWLLLVIQHAWVYYRRYQEREKEALRLELRTSELQSQLAQAQLGALKMQLQPHFLFNTLNAITVLVRQRKSREAEDVIAKFSDLLRNVLEDVDAQEVSLRRELEYLRLYLSIEQVRFRDRLHIEILTAPETLEAGVPHMVLQPIVENAIRHGIGRSSSAGQVAIRTVLSGDQLVIEIQDDGPGLPSGFSTHGHGIGLANTRARLLKLYGNGASLKLETANGGGTVVTIVLPYRRIEETAELENVTAYELEDADR